MTKTFLHVGAGTKYKDQTTKIFNSEEWKEVRLDIEAETKPDIVASILDMSCIDDGTYDAVYSAHNIEHVYAHEVIQALNEFKRVLNDDGFLILTCPDIKRVCALIGEGKIGELLYTAPVGDIYPLDVLYGYRRIIADGGYSMAHKNGFTGESLHDWFRVSSFKSFITAQDDNHYALWAIAYKTKERTLEQMKSELSLHLGLS